MMQLIKNLWSLLRPWRATGFSIACLPLLVAAWFQFAGEDSEAESVPNRKPLAMATGGRIYLDYDDLDAGQAGSVIPASATESSKAMDGVRNASDVPRDPDAVFQATITGEWEDDYQGKRHLSVAADGTGTMVVELDGIGKKLFAPRLSFDMEWTLADGSVTMKTLGGEPKSKVQLVLKLYGNEAHYKILELTADRMLLLDGDGKTRYDWRRPNSPGTGGTSGTGSP